MVAVWRWIAVADYSSHKAVKLKTTLKVVGFLALIVAAIDLLLGSTDKNVLPDFIANNLTQQKDLALAAVGAGALYLAYKR